MAKSSDDEKKKNTKRKNTCIPYDVLNSILSIKNFLTKI